MSITINNVVLDEEFRATQTGTGDDKDVTTAMYTAASISGEVSGLGLTFVSSPTGFPQYAMNSVSSSNPVTDYYLTLASATGVATPLYVGGNEIFLYATSNPDIVVGRIGTGTTPNSSGAVALIIAIDDSTVSSTNIWVGQFAPIVDAGHNLVDSADQLDLTGLVTINSTFTTTTTVPFENFEGLPSGNNLFNVIWPSDGSTAVEMLVTGSKNGALSTVNVSTTGIGAGSQALDVGATLRIDTVQGMDRTQVDTAPEVNMASHIAYHDLASDPDSDARVEVTAADFEITQVNPGNPNERVDLRVSAFNVAGADQGQIYLNNINSNGTPVQIDAADVIVLNASGQPAAGVTITQDGDSVIIRGLDDGATNDKTDGYQVFITTDGIGFDRLLITNVDSSSTCDVGNFHLTITQGGTDSESTDLGAHLFFQDDGPNIDLVSNGTVPTITDDDSTLLVNEHTNFAGLFTTPDYGADGAGTLEYILGVKSADVDSGLNDAATGQNILLSYDSVTNTVSGTTETGGDTVFVISVSSTGEVTLDQQRAIEHGDNTSFDETSSAMTSDLITLTAKVTDSEGSTTGDSDTAVANIGGAFLFKDDGPSIDDNDPSGSAKVPDTTLDFGAGPDNTTGLGSFGASSGNDGPSSGFVTIADWADMTSVGLTATLTGGGTVLTYSDGTNDIYRLTVTDSGYDFDVLAQISSPPEPLNFGALKSGSPVETISVPTLTGSHNVVFDGLLFTGAGNNALGSGKTPTSFNPYDLDGLAGHGAASPGDDLNPDNLGFGVKNGQASQINNNEGFFFTVPGQEQLSLSFDVHGVGNLGSIMMEYWVYDSSNNEIEYQLQNVTGLKTGDQTVTIHDLQGEEFSSAYVRFFFTNGDANAGVRIINFESQMATDAPDRDIQFQLASTDTEGDQALSNIFTVHVDNPAYTGTADLFGLS